MLGLLLQRPDEHGFGCGGQQGGGDEGGGDEGKKDGAVHVVYGLWLGLGLYPLIGMTGLGLGLDVVT